MATTTYKRLASNTGTTALSACKSLYTVTSPTSIALISTITVCNTDSSSQKYRLCVANATDSTNGTVFPASVAGYIVYESTVAANDTIFLTVGLTLDTTNKYLLCSSSSALVAFNLFGAEVG